MSLVDRLESRFRRWAVPNLTGIIIGGQMVLYLAERLRMAEGGGDVTKFWLLPGRVLEGEVWRLLTFIFCPPNVTPLFVIFFWLLMFYFGTGLERVWGTARYNLYLIFGILAMMATDFAVWAWLGDEGILMAQAMMLNLTRGVADPSTFLYGSLFLAFARVYPDFIINLFFILPIRIRWLALIQWIAYGYVMIKGDNPVRLLVLASIFNYLLYFARGHWQDVKRGQRRRAYQSRSAAAANSLLHRCRICGLDSESSPKTLFRYCSKCSGQCCYCPEHIANHDHVISKAESADEPATANSGKV